MRKTILIFSLLLICFACKDNGTNWVDPNPSGLQPCVVDSVVPAQEFGGQLVTLYGSGFSEREDGNLVIFGKWPGKIVQQTVNELKVQLPMQTEKQVFVRVAILGSEFWGYWKQEKTDSSGNSYVDTMTFTFNKAISAISDSLFWPSGIISDENENVYLVINQTSNNWAKGIYTIQANGDISLLRATYLHGNLVFGPDDKLWAPNLRPSREIGWVSSMPPDGSASFSKQVKDIVQPSYIDFDYTTGDLYITSRGYYEEIIHETSPGIFDTTIIDKKSGIYKVSSGTTDTVRVADYSRAVSCKIYDGYLYVTQANHKQGSVIMRNEITAGGLGPAEQVLNGYANIHALEFDAQGNMYFVPEGSSTLIKYDPQTGEVLEFYPGDIINTANFLCWSGQYMYLVHTNLPDENAGTATDPGYVQKVFIGTDGYKPY